MSIRNVTTDALRRMSNQEALVIQGCGGDLQEWVDGINDILTQEDILQDGTKFNDCLSFQKNDTTCLAFLFSEDVKINVGKLAMWRLATQGNFGGTWLSDYVPNQLGGYLPEVAPQEEAKPAAKEKLDCALIGHDGNIFNLIGIAARTLRANGMTKEANEMRERISQSGSYDEALGIIGKYVNITGPEEEPDNEPMLGE